MSEQEKDFFEQAMADVVPLESGRQTLYLKPQAAVDKARGAKRSGCGRKTSSAPIFSR